MTTSTSDEVLTLRLAFEKHYIKDDLRPASHRPFRAAFKVWEEIIGHIPVQEITNETLERFRTAAVEKGLSPRTINGYWTHIRSVLRRLGPPHDRNNWGLGIIDRVPAMRPLKVPFKRPRRLTFEELSRMYIAARHMRKPIRGTPQPSVWWQTLLVTAYFTGLRSSDLLSAKWSDVDEQNATLFVEIQKTGVQADLPLHPIVMEHLSRMHRDPDIERIFYVDRAHMYLLWAELRELAGVHFGLHDIRRTACSEIDRAWPGMGKVLLLHAPTNVTERSYLNSLFELREAVEKMDSPIAFRHGIKSAERAIKQARREVEIRREEFAAPMHPPAELFAFHGQGFWFKGRFHKLSGNRLTILETLVRSNGVATARQLWEATSSDPFPENADDRGLLHTQLYSARKSLRRALGLPQSFNPIVQTARWKEGSYGRYELLIPPAYWQEEKAAV